MAEPGSFTARGGWWVVAQVPVMAAALLVPLAWGAHAFEDASPVAWAGALLAALGLLVTLLGFAALGRALTPFPRPRDDATLRQDGIYAWMRHPIYGGIVLAGLGWALAWQSWPGVAAAAMLFAFFDRKSAYEERLLRQRFPDYAEYARRVRKLLPGIY